MCGIPNVILVDWCRFCFSGEHWLFGALALRLHVYKTPIWSPRAVITYWQHLWSAVFDHSVFMRFCSTKRCEMCKHKLWMLWRDWQLTLFIAWISRPICWPGHIVALYCWGGRLCIYNSPNRRNMIWFEWECIHAPSYQYHVSWYDLAKRCYNVNVMSTSNVIKSPTQRSRYGMLINMCFPIWHSNFLPH